MRFSEVELHPKLDVLDLNREMLMLTDIVQSIEALRAPKGES